MRAHQRQLSMASLVIAGLLATTALAPSALAVPAFTGRVDLDFTGPGVVFIDDAHPTDVPVLASSPPGTLSGWDIERVAWFHDPVTDTLYVGLETYGIAGDADGDGDPGGAGAALAAAGGADVPSLGAGESLAIFFDLDEDGDYDLVVGVPEATSLPGVGAFAFNGTLADPGHTFGVPQPQLPVAVFGNPSGAQPHLELTVGSWSATAGLAGAGDTSDGFSALVYFGSTVDAGFGEDWVKDTTWPFQVCLDADQDGVTTCQGDCDDRQPLCVSDCADHDGTGTPDCVDGTCTGDVDGDGIVDCSDPCLDADGDDYGVGPGCIDADCDDTKQLCSTDCTTDIDGDGLTNCVDGCWDSDGDGYGFGAGCLTDDCLDETPLCTTDCSDLDQNGIPDCLQDCIDEDGDGYGEGEGCFGPDCDDAAPLCHEGCEDTDGDGAADCTDPDDDNDNVPDEEEEEEGTDPLDPDSDDDGLDDYEELHQHGTDPLDADSDDDGLDDATEIEGSGPLAGSGSTDPMDPDSDGDGLPDGLEVSVANPVEPGTSSSGLGYGGTDLDGGSFVDDADPDTTTDPTDSDTDGDGVSDGAEDANGDGATVHSIGTTGTDGSGETDPRVADTDGDGLVDGVEPAQYGTSPVDVDSDDDGLWDGEEVTDHLTDPTVADTDGGSVPDGLEVEHGLDPLDPTDDVNTSYLGGSVSAGCGATHPARWGLLFLLALALLLVGLGRRGLIGLLALGLLLGAAGPDRVAEAKARDGFDLQHYQVRAGHDRVFQVEGSEVVPAWAPVIGLWIHYADDPLRREDASLLGVVERDVIDHHVYGELSVGMGFVDLLEAHLLLPVTLYASGQDDAFSNLSSAGVGDLGLRVRFRILDRDPETGGFGLGAGIETRFPIGDASTLYSDDSVRIEPRVMATYEVAGVTMALDLGFLFRTNTSSLANLDLSHELTYGLGARYRVIELLSIGAELSGRTSFASFFSDTANSPLELIGGTSLHLPLGFQIDAGVGMGLIAGYGTPDWRIFAGLQWAWWSTEPPDTDGDGLPDPVDLCPEDPEDMDGFKDTDGCPDLDNDQDGVGDIADRCPLDPEDRDGWWDEDGCPDRDNDEDGLEDAVDKCPNDPETKNGFEDEDGCPDEVPPPEPPIEEQVQVKKTRIEILERVHFAYDSDQIRTESYRLLQQVAKVLIEYSQIQRVEVQGHTDERGSPAYNEDLSRRRAQAVVDFLVNQGVESGRLTAKGYGMSQPIVEGASEESHAENRRVEFHILQRADGE